MQILVKQLEGAAAQKEGALNKRVRELETGLTDARREVSTLRTAAGSEESKARALEQQLEAAHRNALSEVGRERTRLQVCASLLPATQHALSVCDVPGSA